MAGTSFNGKSSGLVSVLGFRFSGLRLRGLRLSGLHLGSSLGLGRFSLGLVESGPERQRVLTVSPDLRDRRPVTISIGD